MCLGSSFRALDYAALGRRDTGERRFRVLGLETQVSACLGLSVSGTWLSTPVGVALSSIFALVSKNLCNF